MRNSFRFRCVFVLFIILFMPAMATGAKLMQTDEIKQGYIKHAALAQLYRWYLFYEHPDYGIDNALNILSSDIKVSSSLGDASGHEEYVKAVSQLPASWKNSHNVHMPSVVINSEGVINLTTDITYLNHGSLENDAIRTAELSYVMTLESDDTILPKFTQITIAQKSEGTTEAFVPSYRHNRVSSLIHYWMALIEDPSRNAEPVKEILSDEFSLNFSSGSITSFDQFREWLAGPGSQVVASTHEVSNLVTEEIAEGVFSATMDLDWNGILPNASEMTAKTRHSWVIEDDPTQRFARIRTMDVEILEPFAPKP